MGFNIRSDPSPLYQSARDTIQHLALRAGSLQPFSLELAIEQLLDKNQQGPVRWAFYLIMDTLKAELAWQHGVDRALGTSSKGLSLQDYLHLVHPDYLKMYLNWAGIASQAGFQLREQVRDGGYGFHITLPLRHSSGQYYWFTQRSFALEVNDAGHYLSHFHLYDYGGPWNVYNRRPFLPCITKYNQPDAGLESLLYRLMSGRIKVRFTPTEQYLLEWYMAGEPPRKVRMAAHTRHEHNSNILLKARRLFCCDFANARLFARFLLDHGLWPQDAIP